MLHASEMLQNKDYLGLNRLFADAYAMTDWISEDYPNHFKHFYTKYVPGVFDGTREIIAYTAEGVIGGIAILKRGEEQKICTIYVKNAYRGQGIATKLLEASFDWLGTTKPLITIAEHKIPMFHHIIVKYHWQTAQILDSSYYGGKSREYVFNAPLT